MEAHIINAPESTRIQDMPSELLYEIFRRVKLEYEDDLDNLQQVCNRWYCIIDQWIGRRVSTSTERVVHPSNPNLSMVGLDLISEIGVNYLHIKRGHGYLPEEPPSPLPSFKLPYLLKHLLLHGPVHPDLFKNLVKKTVNLSVLDVSLAVLRHLRNSDLKHLNFPKLTKLRVTCSKYYMEEIYSELLCLPNLQTFLDNNVFPWLTSLRMDFPISGVETIRALVWFLHRHPQMENLGVRMEFPENFVPRDQEEFISVISQVQSSDCRSLRMVQVDANCANEITGSHPYFEIWKGLVMRQTSLHSLDLHLVGNSNYDMLRAICSHVGSTLVKLTIGAVKDHGQGLAELDCRIFSSLKVIRNLDINDDRLTIIGSMFLPPTLQYLRALAFLRSDETAQILVHLNLRYIHLLCFNFTGAGNDNGELSMETLQQVVQNRRAEELTLRFFPVSDEFPVEQGIPNGDPINPQILSIKLWDVYRGRRSVNIDWKLNESGYYSNIED